MKPFCFDHAPLNQSNTAQVSLRTNLVLCIISFLGGLLFMDSLLVATTAATLPYDQSDSAGPWRRRKTLKLLILSPLADQQQSIMAGGRYSPETQQAAQVVPRAPIQQPAAIPHMDLGYLQTMLDTIMQSQKGGRTDGLSANFLITSSLTGVDSFTSHSPQNPRPPLSLFGILTIPCSVLQPKSRSLSHSRVSRGSARTPRVSGSSWSPSSSTSSVLGTPSSGPRTLGCLSPM